MQVTPWVGMDVGVDVGVDVGMDVGMDVECMMNGTYSTHAIVSCFACMLHVAACATPRNDATCC